MDNAEWTPVARLSEFGAERRLTRAVGGIEVLLVRIEREVLAVANRCTHLGHALDRGRIMSGRITCPFHGACFDLRTGEALSGPAVTPLPRYALRVVDELIEIQVPRTAEQ